MSEGQLDGMDKRSSSLSDPDDGLDEHTTVQIPASSSAIEQEVDSEAETERLEKTPQKQAVSQPKDIEKTPSKLAQEVMASVDSPEPADTNDTTATASVENPASPSRKRKRSSSEPSSLSDIDNGRAPAKLSRTAEEHADGEEEPQTGNANPSSRPSSEREEGNEPPKDTTPAAPVGEALKEGTEEPTPAEEAPLVRARKIGGRGKKGKSFRGHYTKKAAFLQRGPPPVAGEVSYGSDTGAQEDGSLRVCEDVEEGESTSFEEENTKKKGGSDNYGGVDKGYNSFHGILLEHQIIQAEIELGLLQGPNPTHPEYLAQKACIDQRRDKKIHEEIVLFRLQKKTRETAAAAERTTAHSQFFQEVRDIKDKALEAAWQEYFALQKDRRSWGADTTDYTMLYKPSRSVQIREQSARNLEVSILSGIAKHVGFPAAPDMKSLAAAEALADMSKMGTRTTTVPFAHTSSFLTGTNTNGATAEAQFLEQNPWANPQHPAHAHAPYATFNGPAQGTDLVTPAKQMATANPTATNGSQSTVELPSNPPSASVPNMEQAHSSEGTDASIAKVRAALAGTSIVNMPVTTERISTTHSSSNPTTQATPALPAQTPAGKASSPFGSYPMTLGGLEKPGGPKLAT